MWWLTLAPAFAATPDADALRAAWTRDEATVTAGTNVPYDIEAGDFDTLATGEPVAHRFDTPSGASATAAIWIPAPVQDVWVAVQDAPHDPPSAVHATWMTGATPTHRVAYMSLDLPWPMSDRQWVSDIRPDGELYATTERRVWRRTWVLGDPKLVAKPLADGIWLTLNTGAWTLIPVGGGTLAVFTTETLLGGEIPVAISNHWALGTIRSHLKELQGRAAAMPQHYVAGLDPMWAPDGTQLPYGLP